jgi:hypothetical protein
MYKRWNANMIQWQQRRYTGQEGSSLTLAFQYEKGMKKYLLVPSVTLPLEESEGGAANSQSKSI